MLSEQRGPISDEDCDEIIRILDRNGKGNTKDSEAVADTGADREDWGQHGLFYLVAQI